MMSKEEKIELLEYRILKLTNELPMLCDSDYYNQCDLIEQLKMQLDELKGDEKDMIDNIIEDVRDLLDRYTSDEAGMNSRDKFEDIKDNDVALLQLFYNTISGFENKDLGTLRDDFETNIIINFDYNNYQNRSIYEGSIRFK